LVVENEEAFCRERDVNLESIHHIRKSRRINVLNVRQLMIVQKEVR
jgi:hypothetical protein